MVRVRVRIRAWLVIRKGLVEGRATVGLRFRVLSVKNVGAEKKSGYTKLPLCGTKSL